MHDVFPHSPRMAPVSARMRSHDGVAGSSGLFFKANFALLYTLLIVASVAFVRSDESLLDNINIVRIILIGSTGALWVTRSTLDRRVYFSVIVVGILLSPYLLTEAIVSYVDILSLLIFSAALSRAKDTEKFVVYLAYGSLGLVCVIALFAAAGVLPSTIFEWEGRSKNSYGFTNPNTLFFYIFSSAFTFFIYRRWRGLLIAGFIMAVMYASVGSRTFAVAYIFILLGFLFYNRINGRLARLVLWITVLSVAASGILTVYFPFEFSRWSSVVLGVDSDELFSSRLSILEVAYSDVGDVTFWLGGMENTADSVYAYFATSFGLLISITFLFITLYRVAKLSRVYGAIPIIFALAFLMVGIVEVPLDGSALMSLIFLFVTFYDESVFKRWIPTRRPSPQRALVLRR